MIGMMLLRIRDFLHACGEYKNTPNSLYSILVAIIRNCKYSWSVINTMKMQIISKCTASRTLLTVSLIVYVLFSATTLVITESQGKKDYSEKSTNEEANDSSSARSDEKKGGDAIGIKGDQLIYCEGDLNSCHNVLTNIICSNVKYCIVGDITPFVMSNPL
jgi:hypothetical protein